MKETRFYFSTLIVLLLASVYAISGILDTNFFERHYIFTPESLHDLSKSAIALHGNNTKALVSSIVEQLRDDPSISPYLSVEEEWCFNNAGGAMGAMYIIHASKSNPNTLQIGRP